MTTFDLVVLGGGTAGLVAAIGSAALGARVALVEQERLGGECLWTGCVPSKSLIAASDAAERVRLAQRFGIDTARPTANFARVLEYIHGVVASIEPHDSAERLASEGVHVVAGRGRFAGHRRILVETTAGVRTLAYRRALIATGSAPTLPPVPGLAEIEPLTTDTVWDIDALPERLIVIGGGPIGCELGQAFARLGSRVTLIEVAPRLLLDNHPDAARIVEGRLAADGVDVRTHALISAAGRHSGRVEVTLGDGATVTADKVLVSAGRTPRSADLGLETVGVALAERGHVRVDARLRTTGDGIFAAGDVTGAPAFTHVAGYHGGLVAQNAVLGLRRAASYAAIPAVTYTDPEVAQVGLLAAGAGPRARIARVEHSTVDRAIAEGDTTGFTELVADHRGRLVGATVVGPAAGETIGALVGHVRDGTRLRKLAGAVHPYPTRSEAIQRAALEDLRASLVRYRRLLCVYIALRRLLPR